MTSWPDVPYQPEPAGPGSLAGTRTEGAGQPAQSTADGAHLEVRIPSLGDSKCCFKGSLDELAEDSPAGPLEEGRADDDMSDRLFMSPRSDLDPGTAPAGAHRASSIKSVMSVYTDAASDFGGEDPAGTVAATEKDVESGAQPVSAAKAPASSRGRAMLVPTDGGLAQRAHLARILAQQLSVGLWLMPFAFSRLGWASAGIALSVSSFGSMVSAALQRHLTRHAASEHEGGAVGDGVLLLHDLLLAAVLQLLAVQSLQHLTQWGIGRWAYGGAVAAAVLVLSQARYLSRPAVVLIVAAASVGVAYSISVGWFVGHRIRLVQHAAFAQNEATTLATAGLSIMFCFRVVAPAPGQSGTAVAATQQSSLWASGAAVAFAVSAISVLGGVGYWSQGSLAPEVIGWGIENRALQRVTTTAILIQAVALYLATLSGLFERTQLALGVPASDSQEMEPPLKGRRVSWLAVAGWLVSYPVTIALALVTAALRPHLIQLVALAAVAKNLCCLTVPAFLCLRKLPRRQHWVWTIAQAVVLTLSLGAVGFGSYASLTALQQQAQAASLAG